MFPFSAESFGDVVIGDLAFGAPLTRLPLLTNDTGGGTITLRTDNVVITVRRGEWSLASPEFVELGGLRHDRFPWSSPKRSEGC